MFEAPQREWRFYVSDMMTFAENVMSYTDGFDLDRFVNSGITYDATLHNLELIGEAAIHIPPEIREQYCNIPWRRIIATRGQTSCPPD